MGHRLVTAARERAQREPPVALLARLQVGFVVQRACPTCLRGALALRDFLPGDIVAQLPLGLGLAIAPGKNMAVRVGPASSRDTLRSRDYGVPCLTLRWERG